MARGEFTLLLYLFVNFIDAYKSKSTLFTMVYVKLVCPQNYKSYRCLKLKDTINFAQNSHLFDN